jgi:hypothetical protein
MENYNCQEIISTLLRVNKKHDHDAATMFVRELAVMTAAGEFKCSHLRMGEVFANYVKYIGENDINRILDFEETFKDREKARFAHMTLGDEFCTHLCGERTWATWFGSIFRK